MSPEVQIQLIEALKIIVPAILSFLAGWQAPQPKFAKRDK